ncbi:DedA family protein [Clostridium thermarum]|uniref:DedA family protein n=1 Tax=Clostridium thermarum TaxID=1716543 RepID=UPI00111E6051|nr:VTT domain-containing protein [Clostridium thermarum]
MNDIIQAALKEITHVSPWVEYFVLLVSGVLQMIFPPYPGDTILVLSGCLLSLGMEGGNAPILASYVIGTIVSSYALYLLGLRNGEAVLNYKLVEKYFHKERQDKVKQLIWKYGIFIFFISKFIPGLNSITIVFGGIFKYSPLATLIVISISSLVHNFIFFLIGKGIGYNLDKIDKFLSTYNTVALVLFLGCIIAFVVYKLKKRHKSQRVKP